MPSSSITTPNRVFFRAQKSSAAGIPCAQTTRPPLSRTGQPLSGATGYSSTQLGFPISLAIDANHNAWVGNTYGNTVTKVSPDGSQFTSYSCCDWAGGIAIDQRGDVWVANYMADSISQLASDGTVISSGYSGR